MSSVIEKISKRAKQIRAKKPGMKWQSAIKQASKELRGKAPKKKAAKKRKVSSHQTGKSSTLHDERFAAKAPGKRIVKTAKGSHVYYERRKNRSDKPGSLSGITASRLKSELKQRLEDKLGKTFVQKSNATTKRVKNKLQKVITATRREIKKLK
jgi:hypothetical protein